MDKGGGNTPPDSELRNIAIPLPELRKPVATAINEANQQWRYNNNRLDQGIDTFGPGVVQPWNGTQQQGFDLGVNTANNVNGILRPSQEFSGWVGSGGAVGRTPGQEFLNGLGQGGMIGKLPGQGTLNDLAAGNFGSPATDPLQALMARAQGGSGGVDMIRNTASGAMLGGNPNLDAVIGDQARSLTRNYGDAVAGIEGRMSGAGRLGSNAEMDLQGRAQENLAQGLGDLENRVRYQDYANERGLQQQAQLALPGAFATDIGTGVNAANAAGADNWQRLQTMLSGAQAATGSARADQQLAAQAAQTGGNLYQNSMAQALQAAGMAPQFAQASFMAPDALMKYGTQAQQQAQQQAQEGQDRFRYNQDADWQNLQRYIGSLQGAAGLSNPNAAAMMPQQQGSGSADLANYAAIAGSIAMMACDERLKADVERLADLPSGAGYYRFRYLWDEPGTVRFGPMAQDLMRHLPEAVANVGGVLMVDLAKVA